MPAHGASYVVTGSGFGSKDKSAPLLWDDCSHGQAYTARWTRRWHVNAPLEDYMTPAEAGRSVALPHSHVTKYGCGRTEFAADGDAQAVMFIKEIPKLADPWWIVFSHYWRIDPLWEFLGTAPGDYNFKRMGMSASNYPLADANWFFAFTAGAFTSSTVKPLDLMCQDNASGWNFQINGTTDAHINPDMNANPTEGWIKEEYALRMSATSGEGRVYFYTDQGGVGHATHFAVTANTRTDIATGTKRTVNTGAVYVRDRGPENWVYWGDNYIDHDSNSPARIHLTDNATYASSTRFETQPYSAWSDTSITLTCNQGMLPDGTAHVHLRDELNGHQYLGTVTLGAGGAATSIGSSLGGLG